MLLKMIDKHLNLYFLTPWVLRNFIPGKKIYNRKQKYTFLVCFMFHLKSHPGKKGWLFFRTGLIVGFYLFLFRNSVLI